MMWETLRLFRLPILILGVTVKKAFFEEEAKGVARQPFPNALEESKEQSIQLHMWLFETLD